MADRVPAQGATAARERWPRSLRIFKAAVETTITSHGKPMRPDGSNDLFKDDDLTVRAVALDTVRFEFVAAYPAEGGDAKAKREAKLKAFKRALKQARNNGLVGSREIAGIDYVWLVEPASAAQGNNDRPATCFTAGQDRRTSEPDRQDTLLVSCLVCPVFGHGQDGQMSGLSGLSDRWVPTGQTGHLSKKMSGLSCPVGVPYLCWRWLDLIGAAVTVFVRAAGLAAE